MLVNGVRFFAQYSGLEKHEELTMLKCNLRVALSPSQRHERGGGIEIVIIRALVEGLVLKYRRPYCLLFLLTLFFLPFVRFVHTHSTQDCSDVRTRRNRQ